MVSTKFKNETCWHRCGMINEFPTIQQQNAHTQTNKHGTNDYGKTKGRIEKK